MAMLHLPRLYALRGQTLFAAQARAQLRSIGPTTRPAHHFSVALQNDRGAGCPSGQACLLHNFVEHNVQRQTRREFRRNPASSVRGKLCRQIRQVRFHPRPRRLRRGFALCALFCCRQSWFCGIRPEYRMVRHTRRTAERNICVLSGVSPQIRGLSICIRCPRNVRPAVPKR